MKPFIEGSAWSRSAPGSYGSGAEIEGRPIQRGSAGSWGRVAPRKRLRSNPGARAPAGRPPIARRSRWFSQNACVRSRRPCASGRHPGPEMASVLGDRRRTATARRRPCTSIRKPRTALSCGGRRRGIARVVARSCPLEHLIERVEPRVRLLAVEVGRERLEVVVRLPVAAAPRQQLEAPERGASREFLP